MREKTLTQRSQFSLYQLRDNIIERRNQKPNERARLVGLSGIDASGKCFIAGRLARDLKAHSFSRKSTRRISISRSGSRSELDKKRR